MTRTINQVSREITQTYLDSIDKTNPPEPSVIESEILDLVRIEFETENNLRAKGDKWKIPQVLNFAQIATIMANLYPIACVRTNSTTTDSDYDILMIYQTDGINKGTYVSDTEVFRKIAREYCYTLSKRDFDECMNMLRDIVPHKDKTTDKDLLAVNNGIFDYQTKKLMDFHPDFIFTSKSRVNYNEHATNVIIHNPDDNTDWDVESWMKELSDDPDIVNLLWEIIGATLRPNVNWNKAAWFYSEQGNNGKGTLCELMRQLIGSGSSVSLQLNDMGKDFALEPLIHATAIITDENDVGTYVDKAANLKALVTGDTVMVNRKFKTAIPMQFHGFMIQCLNEMPRIKDKSDSFFRRQLFIPFTKCFTGIERKYIKHDYLQRQEVLEYVMYRVLNMNYDDFHVPESCLEALDEYKEYNDPIRQFKNDVIDRATWDLLPFQLLYEIYQKWYKQENPSGPLQSKNSFITDLIQVIATDTEWMCPGRRAKIKTGNQMSAPELLLEEFQMTNWQNQRFLRPADDKIARCTLDAGQYLQSYRGIRRITPKSSNQVPAIVTKG